MVREKNLDFRVMRQHPLTPMALALHYHLWVVIKENISFLSSCGRINRGPSSCERGEVVGDVDRGGGRPVCPSSMVTLTTGQKPCSCCFLVVEAFEQPS